MWDQTAFAHLFDATLLSSEVGLAKPDSRIYEKAAKVLGVTPAHCLYVGDGSGRELSGASRSGMTAALMRAPYDLEDGNREGWEGERISSIRQVIGLL